MKASTQGFTLLELLVVMVVAGILVTALAAILQGGTSSARLQQQRTGLTQNTEVAAALLRSELKTAGFLGSTAEISGSGANDVGVWVPKISPFRKRFPPLVSSASFDPLSGTDAPPPAVTVNVAACGTPTGCDTVSLVRVKAIDTTAGAAQPFTLEKVTYTATKDATSDDYNLMRTVTLYACTDPGGVTVSTCTPGVTTGPDPAVQGVEDFEVFYQGTDAAGTYKSTIGALTCTASPGSGLPCLGNVGVYLRVRAPIADPSYNDTRSYPTTSLLPATATASSIGIPNFTPGSTNNTFRRTEKVFYIGVLNPASFSP